MFVVLLTCTSECFSGVRVGYKKKRNSEFGCCGSLIFFSFYFPIVSGLDIYLMYQFDSVRTTKKKKLNVIHSNKKNNFSKTLPCKPIQGH